MGKAAVINSSGAPEYQVKTELRDNVGDEDLTVWCADYTKSPPASGTVGMAQVPGEDPQMRPFDDGRGVYSLARDGKISKPGQLTWLEFFYNTAMLPGWQKWMPRYRYATVRAITDQQKKDNQVPVTYISVDPSTEQGININTPDLPTLIPAQYMECDAYAFEAGDVVLVEINPQIVATGMDRTITYDPKIIGFKEDPRPCGFLIRLMRDDGEYVKLPEGANRVWISPANDVFKWEGPAEYVGEERGVEGLWFIPAPDKDSPNYDADGYFINVDVTDSVYTYYKSGDEPDDPLIRSYKSHEWSVFDPSDAYQQGYYEILDVPYYKTFATVTEKTEVDGEIYISTTAFRVSSDCTFEKIFCDAPPYGWDNGNARDHRDLVWYSQNNYIFNDGSGDLIQIKATREIMSSIPYQVRFTAETWAVRFVQCRNPIRTTGIGFESCESTWGHFYYWNPGLYELDVKAGLVKISSEANSWEDYAGTGKNTTRSDNFEYAPTFEPGGIVVSRSHEMVVESTTEAINPSTFTELYWTSIDDDPNPVRMAECQNVPTEGTFEAVSLNSIPRVDFGYNF